MSPAALRSTDVIGGLISLGLAAGVLAESSSYARGTLLRMGPGYFPTVLGALLLGLGALLAVRGLLRHGETIALPRLRPVVCIAAAVSLFTYTLPTFGLAPAILLLVGVSACASPVRRPFAIMLLAVGLTVFAYVVFVRLLALHIDVFRW